MRLSRLLLHALPLLFLLVACSPRSTESTATPTVSKPRSPTPAITPTPTLTASPRPTQTQEPAPSAASKATPALPLRFGNAYSPSLSADGRYLAFVSFVDNRSAIYLFNRSTGEYQFLDEGWSVAPRFSPDGRYMVYLDISSQGIVYVYDRSTGESEPVNLSSTGILDGQGACCPTISEDVRYVAFGSLDDNLAEGGILEE